MNARIAISSILLLLAAGAAGCQSDDGGGAQESASARDGVAAVEASAPVTPPFDVDLRLVELDGLPLDELPGGQPAELRFDAAEGRISGSSGVNDLHGPYSLHGKKLRFGPMVMTRRGGSQPAMQREAALLRALSRTEAWRPAGGGIELLDWSGNALARFER